MENDYLNIMIQSLQKKVKILDKIIEMNKEQHQIILILQIGVCQNKEEILILKQLITEITERSVNIQSEEVRNRKLVEMRFSQERKKVRNMKNSSTVANQYYKTMTKLNHIDAQFMDRKKQQLSKLKVKLFLS